MEPDLCSDKDSVISDTGQSASAVASAATPTPAPVELTAGEGFVNNQDGLMDAADSSAQIRQSSANQEDCVSLSVLSDEECVSVEDVSCIGYGECDSTTSDGQASMEGADGSGGNIQDLKLVDVKPKIIIELEDEDAREEGSSNDEDMDPLITVDDTESQSSDLINFDTVSYDIINQPGAEDDEDERSIATISSLSCDVKMDSPIKISEGSNSSSLVNLLDSSLKESPEVATSLSTLMLLDSVRSCPASPSMQSSKTMSSAAHDSNPEAYVSVMQVTENNSSTADCFKPMSPIHLESAIILGDHKEESNEHVPNPDLGSVDPATQDCNLVTVSEKCVSAENACCEYDSGNINCDTLPMVETNLPTVGMTSEQLLLNSNDNQNKFLISETSSSLEKINQNQQSPINNIEEFNIVCKSDLNAFDVPVEPPQEVTDPQDTKLRDIPESLGNLPFQMQDHIVQDFTITPVESTGESEPVNSVISNSNEKNVPVDSPSEVSISCKQSTPEDPSVPASSLQSASVNEQPVTVNTETIHIPHSPVSSTSEDGSDLDLTSKDRNEYPVVSSTSENITTAKGVCGETRGEDLVVTSTVGEETLVTNFSVKADSFPATSFNKNKTTLMEGNILSLSSPFVNGNENARDVSDNDQHNMMKTSNVNQKARTPSPVYSAVSVTNSVATEESVQLRSGDNSNEMAELSSLEAMSVVSTEILPAEHEQLRDAVLEADISGTTSQSSAPSSLEKLSHLATPPEKLAAVSDNLSFQIPSKVDPSCSEGKLDIDIGLPSYDLNVLQKIQPQNEECISNFISSNLPTNEAKFSEEFETKDLSMPLLSPFESQTSVMQERNVGFPTGNLKENDVDGRVLDLESKICQVEGNDLETVTTPTEVHASKSKRPTTLPDINLTKLTSDKHGGLNFSEFLDLINNEGLSHSASIKQYSVTALDEAQQLASGLVDSILQIAVLKAEEKLTTSKQLVTKQVEAAGAAHALVNEVLSVAAARTCSVREEAEISKTCDMSHWEKDTPIGQSYVENVETELSDGTGISSVCALDLSTIGAVSKSSGSLPSSSCAEVDQNQAQSDRNLQQRTSPSLQSDCFCVTDQDKLPIAPSQQEISTSFSNPSSEVDLKISDKGSSETLNEFGGNSLSESSDGGLPKEETGQTSFSGNGATDSLHSSLLTSSDIGLRSEASLFVDGLLEEAVKKYEESSSSETSPVKVKGLALESDFLQEEELTTPCGEMLTEHFMDFESGRNVSVFCTIPESGSQDHLLAFDRTAHTIGNREVDSDTGKSVSVFRVDEDVYYEIQRASTCTSVFESVEEEDEDMIDTTVPVEERPPRTMKQSVSLPSFDSDMMEISDSDAFEDAVGAFLTKERLARNEIRRVRVTEIKDAGDMEVPEANSCRALVLKHPVHDLSNEEEKRRMAEKWANGGESEVPDTLEMREKQRAIREALDSEDDVAVKLCKLALTEGGLINDSLRREAWPRMLGLDPTLEIDAPSLEDLKSHPEYGQVVLDVNRSLKRFPPDIPKDRRETLQDKLTRLIMYVISKHPHLRYYQGYHDVAVTFLLVVGESVAFQIMERLSTEHLSDCMQPTMERTSYLLHFIYPLLHRLHPTLADYLERSEVGTMFCLPWFLTWFGHSLDRYQDVVRLYDHFLASPPLAPLYVAAVLVAHRADEVLAVDCDMAAIHSLLSHIPDTLPLEILLRDATELYIKFPPESIEKEVEERFRNEQELRNHEMEARERMQRQRALRRRRGHSHGSGSWQLAEIHNRVGGSMMVLNRWMPPWVVQQQRLSMRLLFASATFFVGFYVYSRGGDMLPYL